MIIMSVSQLTMSDKLIPVLTPLPILSTTYYMATTDGIMIFFTQDYAAALSVWQSRSEGSHISRFLVDGAGWVTPG
jgi:hypothetical protein